MRALRLLYGKSVPFRAVCGCANCEIKREEVRTSKGFKLKGEVYSLIAMLKCVYDKGEN